MDDMALWLHARGHLVENVAGTQLRAGDELLVVDPGAWGIAGGGQLLRRGRSPRPGDGIEVMGDHGMHATIPRTAFQRNFVRSALSAVTDGAVADWFRGDPNAAFGTPAGWMPQRGRVVRILHPGLDGRTWRDHVTSLGATFHPLVQFESALLHADPATRRRRGTSFIDLYNETINTIDDDLPRPQERHLVGILARHTTTPDDAVHGICPIRNNVAASRWPDAAWLERPGRRYHLVRGPVAHDEGVDVPDDPPWAADLVFPHDGAWARWTDVDLCWTYITGPDRLVDDLLADDVLETVEVDWHDDLSVHGDTVNGGIPRTR